MTNNKSSVLLISICSRNKRKGGTKVYLSSNAIGRSLQCHYSDLLLKMRRNLLHNLSEIHWHNVPIDELKMNQNLKEGPDFGGTEKGEYLPAIMRYSGRYYNALSQKISFLYEILTTPHNFLILSGLYGLVTLSEPIQRYTCPVEIE